MIVDVRREACCSQDDQLGPLEMRFELPDDCGLQNVLTAVMDSRFLQFTSTHAEMSCRVNGADVARVFSPYARPLRNAEFTVAPESRFQSLGFGSVEFVFDRLRHTPRAA
jgi:hypothetical protein